MCSATSRDYGFGTAAKPRLIGFHQWQWLSNPNHGVQIGNADYIYILVVFHRSFFTTHPMMCHSRKKCPQVIFVPTVFSGELTLIDYKGFPIPVFPCSATKSVTLVPRHKRCEEEKGFSVFTDSCSKSGQLPNAGRAY